VHPVGVRVGTRAWGARVVAGRGTGPRPRSPSWGCRRASIPRVGRWRPTWPDGPGTRWRA